ncbi:MAG: acyl-ACP--UDP-N-acetylglucosamine O-acyltransferase [bacterium JZ-2024 1]
MRRIHPTAVVAENVQMGENVSIGAYSVIEGDVFIGNDVEIGDWVFIGSRTFLGNDVRVFHGSVIGTPPQHREKYGEKGSVKIGEKTTIREYVTIHRATEENQATEIGPECYIMCFSHIGHDGKIGRGVVLTNLATLGGFVEIGDFAVIGGFVAVHQNIHIGTLAMVGGTTGVNKHIPPYATAMGPAPPLLYHINRVGMRRRGMPAERIREIEECYRILRRIPQREEALEQIRQNVPPSAERDNLLNFLENYSPIASFATL